MKAHLAIVSAETPREAAHLRPFRTMYYGSVRAKPAEWAARGAACTLRGAARAAFLRILDRRAALALVHDEDGAVVARIWRERGIRSIGV